MKHRNCIIQGDVLDVLRTLPDGFVQCCVTSPPYWGLRDYGVAGQLGLEKTMDCLGWATGKRCGECYICRMTAVFREVRRVLRDDGTCWCNMGDSYSSSTMNNGGYSDKSTLAGFSRPDTKGRLACEAAVPRPKETGLKPKDLCGIPWRLAFALQADGWWLRQDIIWHKPNPMPESVTDRCTKAHEYIFLLTKRAKYYYDAEAVKEEGQYGYSPKPRMFDRIGNMDSNPERTKGTTSGGKDGSGGTRNRRSVWTIPTHRFPDAHFATFPPKLIEPCILAGSKPGDVVLDPFMGSGTTALVAYEYGRNWLGIELNPKYADMARCRIAKAQGKYGLLEAKA